MFGLKVATTLRSNTDTAPAGRWKCGELTRNIKAAKIEFDR